MLYFFIYNVIDRWTGEYTSKHIINRNNPYHTIIKLISSVHCYLLSVSYNKYDFLTDKK